MKKPSKKIKTTAKASEKPKAPKTEATIFTPPLPPEVKREAKRTDKRNIKEVVGDGEEFEVVEVAEVPTPKRKAKEVKEVPQKEVKEIPTKKQGLGKNAPKTKRV